MQNYESTFNILLSSTYQQHYIKDLRSFINIQLLSHHIQSLHYVWTSPVVNSLRTQSSSQIHQQTLYQQEKHRGNDQDITAASIYEKSDWITAS